MRSRLRLLTRSAGRANACARCRLPLAARHRALRSSATPADGDPEPARWEGASSLVAVVTVVNEAAAAARCCTATLWEVPLPHAPPFAPQDCPRAGAAGGGAVPPPFVLRSYANVFFGPRPPEDDEDRFDAFHPLHTGVGPLVCQPRAQVVCVDATDGTLFLRDIVSGAATRLACLTALGPATALRSVSLDEHGSGARCILAETMGDARRGTVFTWIDAEKDVQLSSFRVPAAQVSIGHSLRLSRWCTPQSPYMITAQAVALPEDPGRPGPAAAAATALRAATRRDGATCIADAAGEAAAAETARDVTAILGTDAVPPTPFVVLYRFWDYATGAPLVRTALPALTAPEPLMDGHSSIITCEQFHPARSAMRTLVVQRNALQRDAHLALYDERGRRVPLPATAVLAPQSDEYYSLTDSYRSASSWRFAAVAHMPGPPERTSIVLLDFLQHEEAPPRRTRQLRQLR